MIRQRTLAHSGCITGVGIHSGRRVQMKLHPAPADYGIKFRRIDLNDAPLISAHTFNVGATENNTTLGSGENCVHTVEHLLSALYGLGVNNAYIEIDGPEVPIMDGSAASFVFYLKEIGVDVLNKSRKFCIILETVRIEVGEKWAMVEPHSHLVIDAAITFAHPVIKTQRREFNFSTEEYCKEISRARTFGFVKQIDELKRKGLARGASLDNAIGLDDFHVMNPDGLRYGDEFIRHKILDAVGDMSLLGTELVGKVTTYKAGHNLHNLLCRKILSNEGSYRIVSSSSLSQETQKFYQREPSLVSV